jgi:hypothetical protein
VSLIGWQSRYAELVQRLTGGEPDLVPPGLQLEDASDHEELAFLKRERLCWLAASLLAQGVGIASGVMLRPTQIQTDPAKILTVITGVQLQKAVAGNVSLQTADTSTAFGGSFTTIQGNTFLRDDRWGLTATTRTSTRAFLHATGGLPAQNLFKRVFLPANTFVAVPFVHPLILTTGVFGVFNETANEALDVMIDWYEREARPEELTLA